ncbi:PspC domain-containing protein [Streptomyces sp. NBC_00083]|uniref:PspC domain-containing protein n=1 Tax=Streptomyces sp. NBC_00083 TaxID=2975647 RepID=UPI002251A079|nr:PspC domain-containing protein [Streptomyces sp. NBC_00083]MCX5385133.1 PspC domain-containing protein [Streptomyces sp. NBC_00083]
MSTPTETPLAPTDPAPGPPQLRRSGRNKVIGGVCGGLGRYCDLDPVIFRIALGVLAATGGLGLVLYGFAWLLLPLDGEEENEARRLLTGRVEGAALVAVLMALAGCGIFLTMLKNGPVMTFAVLLVLLTAGAGVWSQRRAATPADTPLDPAAAQAVADAPPETKAPPTPSPPSWWRDPIIKDGTTGPVATGYLWGPADACEVPAAKPGRAAKAAVRADRGPRPIGGPVLLAALLAFGAGLGARWGHQPLGTGLQIGFAAALAVFGLGLLLSSVVGRTGFGTLFLAVLTAALLAGSAALPKTIDTHWRRTGWTPAAIGEVRPEYRLGTGVATLDLSRITVPAGQTLTTRAEVGAGRARVVVPKDVTVKVSFDLGVADIRLPGEKPDDLRISADDKGTTTLAPPAGTTPSGTLELRLAVAVGQAEVDRAAS